MSIDDELRDELIDGERAVPVDAAGDERIRARMLAAFNDANSDVVELESYTDVAAPSDRARRRPLFLVAAASMLVLGGAVALILAMQDDTGDTGLVAAATPAPALDSSTEPGRSALGYLPFSNYSLLADEGSTTAASIEITDRSTAATPQADGTTTFEVRRQLSGSLLPPQDDTEFVITVTADGRTFVPIEVAFPVLADGTANGCTGTPVEIGRSAPDQDLTVTCDGLPVDVTVIVARGATEQLPLVEVPVAATPVMFTATTDLGLLAVSTHWYDPYGLVRQDIEVLGVVYEAEMNAGDLTRRNIALGIVEGSD